MKMWCGCKNERHEWKNFSQRVDELQHKSWNFKTCHTEARPIKQLTVSADPYWLDDYIDKRHHHGKAPNKTCRNKEQIAMLLLNVAFNCKQTSLDVSKKAILKQKTFLKDSSLFAVPF